MTEGDRRMTGDETEDDAALAVFFGAARNTAEPTLPPALFADILADAAAVTAGRRPALPVRRNAPVPRWRWRFGRLAAPLGGWPGAAVLGASAAAGFWIGIAGGLSIDRSTGTVVTDSAWTVSGDDTASEAAGDPVASFYDYAALEG